MDTLTFYFDRCFGNRFPKALHEAKPPFNVEFHHNPKLKFPQNMPDDKWLSIVGQKGWFVFSHDRKFHTELAEYTAIKQHGIGCFYLWGSNAQTWEKLRCFMRAYDRIRIAALATDSPFIYDVAENGRLKKVKLP